MLRATKWSYFAIILVFAVIIITCSVILLGVVLAEESTITKKWCLQKIVWVMCQNVFATRCVPLVLGRLGRRGSQTFLTQQQHLPYAAYFPMPYFVPCHKFGPVWMHRASGRGSTATLLLSRSEEWNPQEPRDDCELRLNSYLPYFCKFVFNEISRTHPVIVFFVCLLFR